MLNSANISKKIKYLQSMGYVLSQSCLTHKSSYLSQNRYFCMNIKKIKDFQFESDFKLGNKQTNNQFVMLFYKILTI